MASLKVMSILICGIVFNSEAMLCKMLSKFRQTAAHKVKPQAKISYADLKEKYAIRTVQLRSLQMNLDRVRKENEKLRESNDERARLLKFHLKQQAQGHKK